VVKALLLIAAVAMTVPAISFAAPETCAKKKKKKLSRRQARAQAAFERATALFDADEFEAALVYFKEAYEYSGKRPSTIMALAQCERITKRYDDALLHLGEYLETNLSEAERVKVRETIQVVEELKAIAAREAAQVVETATVAAPPPPPVQIVAAPIPPAEEDGLLEDPIFWIIVGSVLVAGGAAAGIAVAATDRDAYAGSTQVLAQPDLQ
jgi:hypothetical protein